MTPRSAAFAACLTATASLIAPSGRAATTDILIGLDEKITYNAEGPANGPGGKDAVVVMDIADPAKPRIRASLPLMNSLLGPPTNLQITPDGKLGLVTNSVVMNQDGAAWKTAPDDKLFVIDLAAEPPKLADTVTVGKQPSGLAISHKGDLALIANRAGKSVSVVSIQGGTVKAVGEVPMEQEAAAVAITPDGKRGFVCLNLVNKIGVLAIDGQTVSYDKTLDIPAAFNPYNIAVTPDGKHVIVSTTGASGLNGDALIVIDPAGAHPHVVSLTTVGNGPEGFAISPDGKFLATALLLGSAAKQSAYFHSKGGQLALVALGPEGELTVKSRAPLGGLPEGIAFSPKSDYLYVGNYIGRDLQTFHIENGALKQVGENMKLPGQPASMRGPAR